MTLLLALHCAAGSALTGSHRARRSNHCGGHCTHRQVYCPRWYLITVLFCSLFANTAVHVLLHTAVHCRIVMRTHVHPPPTPTHPQAGVLARSQCGVLCAGARGPQSSPSAMQAAPCTQPAPRPATRPLSLARARTCTRAHAQLQPCPLQACGGPGQHPRSLPARNGRSQCRLPLRTPACCGRQASTPCARAGTGAQRGCIRHEHGGTVCIRPHHTPHALLSSTISSSVHLRPAEPTRLLSCLQDTKTVPIHALHTVHSVPEANTTASGHGMGSSGSVGELAIPRNLIQWFGARTGRLVHRNCVLQTVRD